MDECIKKIRYICVCVLYICDICIYTHMPFATTWMDFEGITLSKISETEKDV